MKIVVTAAQMLIPLIVFSVWLYPHIKFVGGHPTPVLITVLPPIEPKVLQTFPAVIVDETTDGFYITGRQDKKEHIRFIPRSSVTSLEFHERPDLFVF